MNAIGLFFIFTISIIPYLTRSFNRRLLPILPNSTKIIHDNTKFYSLFFFIVKTAKARSAEGFISVADDNGTVR